MTIGELLIEYEQNHVINLKSWRNTSRRVQRYIAPLRRALEDQAGRMLRSAQPAPSPERRNEEWPG